MMKKTIISLFLSALMLNSCEEVFYETDLSEVVIEILAPINNAALKAGTQTFSWNPVEGSESYLVQIATPNFENATQIVLDSITKDSLITKELVSNDYQWRIKALNSEYETNFTTYNFTVETGISEVVVEILAPINNAELSTGTQIFTWNPIEGAEEYVIQIATPDFENATQIDVATSSKDIWLSSKYISNY